MIKTDDITHYRTMSHRLVEDLADKLWLPIARLRAIEQAGGFIALGTTDEIQIANDAATLRKLADDLMQVRAGLMDNEYQYLVAAE
jgi:hypothetical protein